MLDFERPIKELEERIAELHRLAGESEGLQAEISRLEEALEAARRRIYTNLSPYQRVQVARHPERPNFRAYRDALCEDFYELSGDRHYGDDAAVRGGFARIRGRNVVLIGHDKGADVKSRVEGNFGMAHPEGYRKVKRLYGLAARFGLPVVTLVDTPGAFAGRGAEERGQAWAISEDLMALAAVPVPVVSVIIGEGGSGGALAMCLADYLGMLENSYLSVIAPEACASIIFRDSSRAPEAAEALKLTARDLKEHGVVDEVLPEPLGGAHRDPEAAIRAVGEALERVLAGVSGSSPEDLLKRRYARYRRIGSYQRLPGPSSG
ncbi:acetyl-coenzyme A carboxylase carboxyl transferase subunit alpha [Rubrobacter xylanophilus DSM 9941]|uniref:Acetyl-coenzyme A carboxylase carboxyl transferase subunit alpha n=1 Tax=Rubrobacter xylanophilus (strain DSM 9941 / JCM 11954 / NBRC 16129 / PRD-1) TaxID=266117 RepID=ACCA_RUBXD|nr:acetyl-CoA carboxylase carboxyltransferase subunit alpha [Rubrobacter xylanophilus]Q1AU97.1 RecName: Full=Acetyl-coenzyme A carboxylase carboxyl transferase subunit alpha; Short=ACCase subunit alpha; Short=Acetyl-CoA carboxylase carboxyltransferase subunit alpha [Rubrobacter xylanophilus DSM 9941]ABG05031.1 acetyl-coenzyme A carboxylase carboxyl transferase subunit alpha [Rubrobacter xylanophilus DSM 9941]